MLISRAKTLSGRLRLPGDKSVSHRAAMLGAIAEGQTNISNFAASADCRSTLSCLRALGVEIIENDSTVIVRGRGKEGLRVPKGKLDCGNSGTTMRLLSGILAGAAFTSLLDGDESLRGRPMKRIIEPLTAMGTTIESHDGRAPLRIVGNPALKAITYSAMIPSAQVKSCVLLAGLFADGQTTVIETAPTRDHTERMLEWMGANVSVETIDGKRVIKMSPGSELHGSEIVVPGDISSAAFFAVAAACLPGSELAIENVGLNATRTAVLNVLNGAGAPIKIENERTVNNEPFGDIKVSGAAGRTLGYSNVIRGSVIANLIDEVPVLCVFGTQLEGGLEIRDAAELRVKESDRIGSVVLNLRKMGANVEEYDDGLKVHPSRLSGTVVDSFGDHRIAMAFAVAGLLADGDTQITGAECVDVSFPEFFSKLKSVVQR